MTRSESSIREWSCLRVNVLWFHNCAELTFGIDFIELWGRIHAAIRDGDRAKRSEKPDHL